MTPNKIGTLAVFGPCDGERVYRAEVNTSTGWRPTAEEKSKGPRTNLADGIYIVTVSENTPAAWISELARKASIAGWGQHFSDHFLPGDNYDSAIAVYKGRVVGGVWVRTSSRTPYLLRLALKTDGTSYTFEELSGEDDPPEDMPQLERNDGELFRPTIMSMWVHKKYRRLGIGRQMVAALAKHFGLPVSEIGIRLPVSAEATRMLMSMNVHEIICGF